jgi:hypothetical protein
MDADYTMTAVYVSAVPKPVGSVRVTIEPAGARNAGAQWRLTSGPDTVWKHSGAVIHNLPAGSTYTITFKPIPGWRTPADQTVTIIANATVSREGRYVQEPPEQQVGTIQVNATLDGKPWSGSVSYRIIGPQNRVGTAVSATFTNMPSGEYQVIYESGGT